jgi:hypothetical protein
VSYDFAMLRCADARQDGHDPRFRLNNAAMSLIRNLLEQQDVLDWQDDGPLTFGGWADEDEATSAAFMQWHAEQRVRVEAQSGERLTVPAVKFESNNGWEVFPLEATRIADALRDTSVEASEAAVAQDHEEAKAKGVDTDWGDTPVEEVIRTAKAFAEFNALSSRYGGYRVG